MQVLPVLDVLDGIVVRGVAGKRENYRPIVSRLTSSCDPLCVAKAIRNQFDLDRFYLADLDGIVHQRPNYDLYRRLTEQGFQLLIDAGACTVTDVSSIRDVAADASIVVGLETCRSPEDLMEIVSQTSDVTFSLDLCSGKARLCPGSHGWRLDPEEIIRQVVQSNVSSILVLDLADVGMRTGGSTDSICRTIRRQFPSISLITGGGIRNLNDLRRFRTQFIDAVLVASALHDGQLNRDDVHSF